MKKVLLIFSAVMCLFFYACNNPGGESKNTKAKDTTTNVQAKSDSSSFKGPHPPPHWAHDPIDFGKAREWIKKYKDSNVQATKDENSYVDVRTLGKLLEQIFDNPDLKPDGIFIKRGMDPEANPNDQTVYLLVWTSITPPAATKCEADLQVYVLNEKSCICRPCCTPQECQ